MFVCVCACARRYNALLEAVLPLLDLRAARSPPHAGALEVSAREAGAEGGGALAGLGARVCRLRHLMLRDVKRGMWARAMAATRGSADYIVNGALDGDTAYDVVVNRWDWASSRGKRTVFWQMFQQLHESVPPHKLRQAVRPWRIEFQGEGGQDAYVGAFWLCVGGEGARAFLRV